MSKATRDLKKLGTGLWSGILYIWNRPLIILVILLAAAYFLFTQIIGQTFKPYTNCGYVIGTKLGMPSFFCDGYTVKDPVFGSTIFTIPGLRGVMDPPLEFARTVIAWSVIVFFAFVSLYLTILINNFKAVVRILTLNKEEWKRLLTSARIWLLIFVAFCSAFYFTVVR